MIGILDAVGNIAGKLVDHFLPPSMSDKEKEEARFKAESLARQLALNEELGFRQFILEYEGRAKDMPWPIKILRSSVRPVLTYLLLITTVWLVWEGKEIPTQLHQLDLLALGFWFGERAVRNFLYSKNTGRGAE